MISMKCDNCASELTFNSNGEIICPYCGSKKHVSDLDLQEYKNFRLNILNYLRAQNDINADGTENDSVWNSHELVSFVAYDGTPINIRYTFCCEEDGVKTYVTKDNIIHVFGKDKDFMADRLINSVAALNYPSAAIKDLSKSFPSVKIRYSLQDGGTLVAISKPANAYPLFAFGNLRPKHVAWIVSRLENMCCVFEYNDKVHRGITTNSVFINPRTHEAFLYGGWWNFRTKNFGDNADLLAIREVATKLMGEYICEAPELFREFIKNPPKADAYDDFALWDDVIVKGFGGHRFTKFETD